MKQQSLTLSQIGILPFEASILSQAFAVDDEQSRSGRVTQIRGLVGSIALFYPYPLAKTGIRKPSRLYKGGIMS